MKKVALVVGVLILAVAAGVFVLTHEEKIKTAILNPDCVSNPAPVFTHYPTDMEKVGLLMPPLMRVASGMKGHSYIDVTERVPVYAPADAVLTGGVKYREDLGNRGDLDQFTLTFIVSCEVYYFFDHVSDPPEKIAQAFAGPARGDTRSESISPIEIKAGDFLGYSAGTGQHNWDFGVVNTTQETILADDPEFNHSDKYRHADCPYEYFEEDKRSVLFGLLGYSGADDLMVIDNLCD